MGWSVVLGVGRMDNVFVDGGGEGTFTASGLGARTTGVTFSGMRQHVFSAADQHHTRLRMLAQGGVTELDPWISLTGNEMTMTSVRAEGNLTAAVESMRLTGDGCVFTGWFVETNKDGIVLNAANENELSSWRIEVGAGVDGINVTNSDRNLFDSILVIGSACGINITDAASDDNYVGALHAPTAVTAPICDTGTGTIISVHTGSGPGAFDHGGLGGLGDIADHPAFLLVDGTRDSTGLQRFDAGVGAVARFGGAGGTQYEIFDSTGFGELIALRVADSTNVFKNRILLISGDAAGGEDILLLKGDGTTTSLLWDESAGDWLVNADWLPTADVSLDLGNAVLTWRDVYADTLVSRANVTTYNIQTATFPIGQTIVAAGQALGLTGTDAGLWISFRHDGANLSGQFGNLVAASDDLYFQSSNGEMWFEARKTAAASADIHLRTDDAGGIIRARLSIIGSGDTQFFKVDGTTLSLLWDETDDQWEIGADLVPFTDATHDLGNATLSFQDLFLTGGINDGAGTQMAAIAELGELTDGSTTTLHNHTGIATEDNIANILLLGEPT